MYSLVVSGSDASSIVFITSTNGTCATTALNRSGPHVDHRAHQQAAGAAALDHQPVGRGVAVLDQVLGAVDEVGEGVHLLHHPALLAPVLAQLAAAADVGDRVDRRRGRAGSGGSTRTSAPTRRRTSRSHRAAAAPCRRARRPSGRRARSAPWCRRGRGPDALRLVVRRVVAAEHLLLLEQRPLRVSSRS